MQQFQAGQTEIHYETAGTPGAEPVILWAHGWGQNHHSFKALAGSFESTGQHIMVDFPGFGASPPPPAVWGTEDYADAMAELIKQNTQGKVIWIGHSFGCRVGLQMAKRHPELIKGLFLIAGAGLKPKRPFRKQLHIKARIWLFKALKKLIPLGLNENWLKSKFGGTDYKNASAIMRSVLVKTINEDLGDVAKEVHCPVILVYGAEDTETPPEIGRRLNTLIKGSKFIELDGQDHYTVLGSGRHQVAPQLKKFIEGLNA